MEVVTSLGARKTLPIACNSKQTPKKNCKLSVPVDISSCQLCGTVGDRLWLKNLFVKRNRAAAEDICGHFETRRQCHYLICYAGRVKDR